MTIFFLTMSPPIFTSLALADLYVRIQLCLAVLHLLRELASHAHAVALGCGLSQLQRLTFGDLVEKAGPGTTVILGVLMAWLLS